MWNLIISLQSLNCWTFHYRNSSLERFLPSLQLYSFRSHSLYLQIHFKRVHYRSNFFQLEFSWHFSQAPSTETLVFTALLNKGNPRFDQAIMMLKKIICLVLETEFTCIINSYVIDCFCIHKHTNPQNLLHRHFIPMGGGGDYSVLWNSDLVSA